MSIRSLLSQNNFDVFANSLNGMALSDLDINTANNGYVLTVTNAGLNKVGFEPPQGGLPSTTEYPNGYVLKILDNNANTYTWAQDSTGGTVPLILTGQSPSALQVRATPFSTPSFTVNTVFNRVDINDNVLIKGNSTAKLKIENDTLDRQFIISTDPLSQPISSVPFPVPIYSLVESIVSEPNYIGSIVKNGSEKVALLSHSTFGSTLVFDTTNQSSILSNDRFYINAVSTEIKTNNPNGARMELDVASVILVSPLTAGEPNAFFQVRKPDVIIPSTSNGQIRFRTVSGGNDNEVNLFLGVNESTLTSDKFLRIQTPNYLFIGNNTSQQNIEMTSVSQIYLETPDFFVDSSAKIEFASPYITMGAPLIEFSTAPRTLAPAVANDELVQKLYVDSRDGYLFSSITNSSLATQVITITDLLDGTPSSGSTLTVPANGFVVGDSFHLSISGTCNFLGTAPNATTGNPTALNLTISLRTNGLLLNAIVVPTKNTGGSSFFEIECDFTIRSIGVSGSIANSFEFTYQIPSTTNFEGNRNTTIGTINTTVSNTLTCIAELQAGYASASVQGLMSILKKTH